MMQLCHRLAKLGQPGHLLRNPITFGDLKTDGFAGHFGLMGMTFEKNNATREVTRRLHGDNWISQSS